MHPEHGSIGEMKPGDDVGSPADGQLAHRRLVLILEDEPGIGSALAALLRGDGRVGQRGLDVADRMQLEIHVRILALERGELGH
jgi:hypothetical protein